MSQDLFNLIKTLSPTEKRYIKLHQGSFNDKATYKRLFEKMDKMKVYDEQTLKLKVNLPNLHVLKNYLYRHILKSLSAYHAENSHHAKLLEMLPQIEVLFYKGLFKQAEKIAENAVKICDESAYDELCIVFLRWKIMINRRLNEQNRAFELLDKSVETSEKVLLKSQTIKASLMTVKQYIDKGLRQDEAEKQALTNTIEKIDKLNPHDCIISAYYVYILNGLKAQLNRKPAEEKTYIQEMLGLFEQKKGIIKEDPIMYVDVLKNACRNQIELGSIGNALEYAYKMRTFHEDYQIKNRADDLIIAQLASFNLELYIYINTNDFGKIATIQEALEKLLCSYYAPKPSNLLLEVQYLMAYAYFLSFDYEESLQWLNRIVHYFNMPLRKDLVSAARIFHLIVNFEVGNHYMIDAGIHSTKKFLTSKNQLGEVEKLILNFLHQAVAHQKTAQADWMNLERQLNSSLVKPENQYFLRYFDIMKWVKQHLQADV